MTTARVNNHPVAVLILKATLEYPQKYGRSKKIAEKTPMGNEVEREIKLVSRGRIDYQRIKS